MNRLFTLCNPYYRYFAYNFQNLVFGVDGANAYDINNSVLFGFKSDEQDFIKTDINYGLNGNSYKWVEAMIGGQGSTAWNNIIAYFTKYNLPLTDA